MAVSNNLLQIAINLLSVTSKYLLSLCNIPDSSEITRKDEDGMVPFFFFFPHRSSWLLKGKQKHKKII